MPNGSIDILPIGIYSGKYPVGIYNMLLLRIVLYLLHGEIFMEITDIRIREVTDNSKLKAYVTVTFDDCFVVHNIKIIKGQDASFIAMPSRKTAAGEYKDVAHPISPEFRAEIQKKIFEKYEAGNAAEDFFVE